MSPIVFGRVESYFVLDMSAKGVSARMQLDLRKGELSGAQLERASFGYRFSVQEDLKKETENNRHHKLN